MAAGDKDEVENEVIAPDTKKSVADIGTDHGLLAMGLALKGNYKQVVGVDVSAQALTYGALALQERIRNQTMSLNDEFLTEYEELPVEFRVGNGLEALEFGEADIIAIAGMGVNVMLQILEHESSMNGTNLEKLGCKRLVLQATNSRPRNLILLYDRLQNRGWKVRDERIEKLSSRWYITTRFELPNDAIRSTQPDVGAGESVDPDLPGLKLRSCKDSSMRKVFDEYCQHHKQWIQQDAKASRQQSDPRELRWLECFFDEQF